MGGRQRRPILVQANACSRGCDRPHEDKQVAPRAARLSGSRAAKVAPALKIRPSFEYLLADRYIFRKRLSSDASDSNRCSRFETLLPPTIRANGWSRVAYIGRPTPSPKVSFPVFPLIHRVDLETQQRGRFRSRRIPIRGPGTTPASRVQLDKLQDGVAVALGRRAQGVQLVEGEPLAPDHRLAPGVALRLIDNPAEPRVGGPPRRRLG